MTVSATEDGVRSTTAQRLRLGQVLLAEWTKTRSVRSTFWLLLAAVVFSITLSGLLAWATVSTWDDQPQAGFEPVSGALVGLVFGQLVVMVFSTLIFTTEYANRSVLNTLTAVPNRTLLLVAKALLVIAITLVIGLIMSFASFFVGQAVYSTEGLETTIGANGVVVALLRGGLLIAMTGLIAMGIGALLRASAAAIATSFSLYFLPILLSGFLPEWWQKNVIKYMPTTSSAVMLYPDPDVPPDIGVTPMSGFLTLCGWALVVLVPAAILLNRRNA
jgi:ABC-2 type transport system permease protein